MPTFPQGLTPAPIWQHFERICGIPHGSGNEGPLRDSHIAWAASRGFSHAVDEVGNLVIRVPASPGREDRATTVIQGHIDMVCEQDADRGIDFATEAIEVYRDGDFVSARGTTLGADNGIGVAAGMAIADDPDAVHGPLELLCTVDEERGMTGAFGLQPGFVTGPRMLNLDTEEEGALYVGCAGGGDVNTAFAIERAAVTDHRVANLVVDGLVGGHSGLDIHRNRGNAIKLLARVLWAGRQAGLALRLSRIDGGTMRNALPRRAVATVAVPSAQWADWAAVVAQQATGLRADYARTDADLTVTLDPAAGQADTGDLDDTSAAPFTADLTDRIIGALMANPSGVTAMSPDVPGLVETSNNLGVVATDDDAVRMTNCTRSSRGPDLETLRDSLAAIYTLAGAEVDLEPSYPGWEPDLSSPLLAEVQRVHTEIFGKKAEIKAIHAGLECGLLKRAYPDMDMISMGPDILGAHSPSERLSISSTQHFYALVKATLAALD